MTPHLGDRVRIHLSGEPDELDAHRGEVLGCATEAKPTPIIGHVSEHEGRIGTVSECGGGIPCRFGAEIDHGYVVLYDEPYFLGGMTRWGGHFAINELEPAAA